MNIYGETQILQEQSFEQDLDFTVARMLEFDLDDPRLTLYKTIKQTKDEVNTIPDSEYLGIYLVSGCDKSIHSFWDHYFNYVKTNRLKVKFFYRGKLHFENIGFMISNENPVFILTGTELIYDSTQVSKIMKTLTQDREIFHNFSSRFFDNYKNYNYISLEISELSIIGLNFNLC